MGSAGAVKNRSVSGLFPAIFAALQQDRQQDQDFGPL
jgi:hypothetical protein